MAGRDDVDEHRAFIDRHDLVFDHTVDPDGALWGRFGISYQPAWVFVNDDGEATLVPGSLGEEGLRAQLDALVAG